MENFSEKIRISSISQKKFLNFHLKISDDLFKSFTRNFWFCVMNLNFSKIQRATAKKFDFLPFFSKSIFL